MGIGSSFSTVPIIATIYVPRASTSAFSPMATIALVGTAAGGDAGSPASDSDARSHLWPHADGQHDHIWDSVVPTFIHYNIPHSDLRLDSCHGALTVHPEQTDKGDPGVAFLVSAQSQDGRLQSPPPRPRAARDRPPGPARPHASCSH